MRKFSPVLFLSVAVAAIFHIIAIGGCTNSAPSIRPTVAIMVTSPDAPPTDGQLAAMQAALEPQLAIRGFQLAKNPVSADYLMHVRFTADKINPPGGHVQFVAIERNQSRSHPRTENGAVEANAAALAELRRAISETEWMNASSK